MVTFVIRSASSFTKSALWNDYCHCSEQFLRNGAKRHCSELYGKANLLKVPGELKAELDEEESLAFLLSCKSIPVLERPGNHHRTGQAGIRASKGLKSRKTHCFYIEVTNAERLKRAASLAELGTHGKAAGRVK